MGEQKYIGSIDELKGCPDSLYTIFPEKDTLPEKAWAFLELHYECGTHNRTANKLGIHHATAKKLYNFLKHTNLWYQFTGIVAETVEDFGTKKNLVNLHEQYQFEVNRLENMIQELLKDEEKIKSLNTERAIIERHSIKATVLAYIKEKRFFMDKQLSAAISLHGKGNETPPKAQEETPKQGKSYEDKRDEVLNTIPDNTN